MPLIVRNIQVRVLLAIAIQSWDSGLAGLVPRPWDPDIVLRRSRDRAFETSEEAPFAWGAWTDRQCSAACQCPTVTPTRSLRLSAGVRVTASNSRPGSRPDRVDDSESPGRGGRGRTPRRSGTMTLGTPRTGLSDTSTQIGREGGPRKTKDGALWHSHRPGVAARESTTSRIGQDPTERGPVNEL